jgi:hypothetical protein
LIHHNMALVYGLVMVTPVYWI